jgi:hypothetical protein
MLTHLFEEVGVCREVCTVPRLRQAMAESGAIGNSPLMAAAWSGHAHLVLYCLARGCDGAATNTRNCMSAVFMAAHCGHCEVVKALVTVGCVDASAPIADGNTPLAAACNAASSQADHPPQEWPRVKAGGLATVRFLLQRGVGGGVGHVAPQTDNPAVRPEARYPIVWAAHNGSLEVVTLLLAAGADPEGGLETREMGKTFPLAVAAAEGHAGVVQALLAAGADAKRLVTVSGNNVTALGPLDIARIAGHGEVCALLEAAGATFAVTPDSAAAAAPGVCAGGRDSAGASAGSGLEGSTTRGLERLCANCGATKGVLSRCGGCKTLMYCSRQCQKTHRPIHRDECADVATKHSGDLFSAEMLREMATGRELSAASRHRPSFTRAKEAGAP